MTLRNIPLAKLRHVGFWAHLMAPGSKPGSFHWRCYDEAPGGIFTTDLIYEGGDGDEAFSPNRFTPPRYPWIAPVRTYQSESLFIGMTKGDTMLAQLVVKEHGGSYAWRRQNPIQGGKMEDAEEFPHPNAFEPNQMDPPRLPWNVFLVPRFVPDEYMFYLGGY